LLFLSRQPEGRAIYIVVCAQKQEQADQADLPAKGKFRVTVDELNSMLTFGEHKSHHRVAYGNGFGRLAVHISRPVAVLGDRGV